MPDVRGIIGPVGDLLVVGQRIRAGHRGRARRQHQQRRGAKTPTPRKPPSNFLKRTAAGRVTFLPLDTMRGGMRDDSGRARGGKPGVIGQAIDYVRTIRASCPPWSICCTAP